MCVCVCVCVFASFCICQLLILYKHTHACALTCVHIIVKTMMMGRETHREGGWKNSSGSSTKEKITSERKTRYVFFFGTQNDCYAVYLI